MDFSKLVFLDTETTGTDSRQDRIIEIALIFMENGQITDRFHTTVNPQTIISPFIKEITGISQDELAASPIFDEIALKLRSSLKGFTIVAHNARFDYSFLKWEFRRLGLEFSSPHLCTVKLSRRLFPHFRHHNLDALISRFQITCDHRHRAMADAQVLVDFYFLLKNQLSNNSLNQAFKSCVRQISTPPNLQDPSILSNLPSAPGVYILYSHDRNILYVGKSRNIKSRLFSHFHDSLSSGREMEILNRTAHIDCLPTAGDLSASLLESLLIKQKDPVYNRRLKPLRKKYFLTQTTLKDGYYSLSLSQSPTMSIKDASQSIGPFRSLSQAQNLLRLLVNDYQLCPKLLGLEKGSPSCFNYHLEKCNGACIGQEHYLKYNLRFLKAISDLRLPSWPFLDAITITETDDDNHLVEHIIINNWQVIKTVTINGTDLPQIKEHDTADFDFDAYKIIRRFLKKSANLKKVSTKKLTF